MEGLKMKYFVLNPNKNNEHGKASRDALLAYSASINNENPVLANELALWVSEIEGNIHQLKNK